MLKGKLSITLTAVAVLAFVLAFLGYIQILVLVVGYALIVEGNNWLTKQTLQALFLCLAYEIVNAIIGAFFGGVVYFFGLIKIGVLYDGASNLRTVCYGIATIGMLVFCIIALTKILKDEDASLPIFGGLADKSLGVIKVKPTPQPQYAPPQYVQPQYTQPQAPPVQAPEGTWVCRCGKVATGRFCEFCGTKKPE